uniref:Retrotransposon gag domain-containing protein n=1 Tax=Ananas comosus var. bracteatus TaxID=296719 RepID=A0A6V7Q9A9_ANACO|nr:unnamed protein product [Ananas comosus var. bracteatus]
MLVRVAPYKPALRRWSSRYIFAVRDWAPKWIAVGKAHSLSGDVDYHGAIRLGTGQTAYGWVYRPDSLRAGLLRFNLTISAEERDRLMERLNEFRRCSPRIFDGEKVDHWIVEKWLMHMEKLFRDTFMEERDRIWLTTHHLDSEAYCWWLDLQENSSTDLAAISWKKFKELLLAHYFPTSVKRKMEQDLRNLRQGDRAVAEVKYVWSPECERSFEELKERLTTTPVVALPTPGRPLWFIVMLPTLDSGVS